MCKNSPSLHWILKEKSTQLASLCQASPPLFSAFGIQIRRSQPLTQTHQILSPAHLFFMKVYQAK